MSYRILIVEADYYAHITGALRSEAERVLQEAGAEFEVEKVPGAFEVPAAIAMAAAGPRPFTGFVALGCVIRGETTHYDYVCGESARALMELSVQQRLPIGLGILTVENEAQALARAETGPDARNKGAEAAKACLRMCALDAWFSRDD